MAEKKCRYPHLFSAGKIGSLIIPNRIVMAPMSTNYVSETGGMTDTLIEFYERRAKGGTGLIIAEHCCVDFPCGKAGAVQLRLDDDRFIPGISRLAEAVHYHGSKIAIQINHSGPSGVPAKTQGQGPVGASAINYSPLLPVPQAIRREEIEIIIEKYAQAALRAKKAGFDAVELHGGHCYLIAHFMSAFTNRRKDEFGGDLKGRLLFPVRIVHRCRELLGDAYPIMMRISGDEFLDGGRSIDESQQVARILAQESVDAIHVTAGTHVSVHPSGTCAADPVAYDQGWRVYLAEAIKSVVDIPVIAVGVIREPEYAEEILKAKRADFVALGRALIADPDWGIKARAGEEKQIRKCISCNEGCIRRRVFMDLPIRCAINGDVGRPTRFRAHPIKGSPRRVLVVGGGPAGMEAARVLKVRGHDVTLWEKKPLLGGQLVFASVPPFKKKLASLVEYLKQQLDHLAISYELNHEASTEKIIEFAPDVLILATGAVPLLPPIPGIDGPLVDAIENVLVKNYVGDGSKIVIMGGGVKGAEVALFLAQRGEIVTIVEMSDVVASDIEPVSRQDLLARLEARQVNLMAGAKILACEDNGLRLSLTNGETVFLAADRAIPCLGYRSLRELETAGIGGVIKTVYCVGDCRQPRMILNAISDAYEVATQI